MGSAAMAFEGTSVMVWLVRQDLVRAVELLEQHNAGELMGQRHRPERELHVAVLQGETARPAHDEAEIPARLAALLQEAAELDRVDLAPLAREQADEGPLRDAPVHVVVLTELDELQAGMAGGPALGGGRVRPPR